MRTKETFPGYYDPAPGGIVLADECSDEASARREISEEMGIDLSHMEKVGDFYYENHKDKLWCSTFVSEWNGDVTIQPEEVEDVKLMNAKKILDLHDHGELFCLDSIQIMKALLKSGRFKII